MVLMNSLMTQLAVQVYGHKYGEGAFSFVSGEIAKTGPDAMKVSTPVATIVFAEQRLRVKLWLKV